jgi:glycerophosphoryl diester phosphodiesterase
MASRPHSRANRFLQRLLDRSGGPLVVAHRGASFHAPENTIEAATRAWQAGAEAWELDVRLTRDGVPVVFHDDSLLRTTDVARRFPDDLRARLGYRVAQFDHDEIGRLDAGSWFLANRPGARNATDFGTRSLIRPEEVDLFGSGAVRVPRLREALELTARLDWLVNIELKSMPRRSTDLLAAVLGEVRGLGLVDRVLVSSFDHRELVHARKVAPGVATGVLVESPLFAADRYVAKLVQADCYHASASALGLAGEVAEDGYDGDRIDTQTLQACRRRGIPVLVYTVNDTRVRGVAQQLVAAGARACSPTTLWGSAPRFRDRAVDSVSPPCQV